MEIIWIVCYITTVMLVWFKTDALIDWGQLIGLGTFLNAFDFYLERFRFAPNEFNYPSYLKIKYPNFLTKLISCPVCLSFWMVLAASFLVGILLLDLWLILFIPVTYILTLMTYGTVTKLLK
jgi:hypothetical protein